MSEVTGGRSFQLSVEREVGAIERVLGVVRRRRLGLEGLSVVPRDGRTWTVHIHAGASEAEAALALRQFASLINVRDARLDDRAAP
ncbi:MAG: hypothetical protein ACRDF0_09320 [Candidatus Limnocylindria bacterium]